MQEQPNWFRQFDAPTKLLPSQIEADRRRNEERIEKAIRERQERDTKRAAERERERLERAASELETYLDEQRQRWIAATGSEIGFNDEIPRLRREHAERGDLFERTMQEMRASGLYSRL